MKNLDFDFIDLVHKSGGRANGAILDKFKDMVSRIVALKVKKSNQELMTEIAGIIYDPTEPFQETLLEKLDELGWRQHAYDSGRAFLEKKGIPIINDEKK